MSYEQQAVMFAQRAARHEAEAVRLAHYAELFPADSPRSRSLRRLSVEFEQQARECSDAAARARYRARLVTNGTCAVSRDFALA